MALYKRGTTAFFRDGPASDQRYRGYRDSRAPRAIVVRGMIEAFWERAGPYLDPNLPELARRDFGAAFWELDLAQTLLANGVPLAEKARPSGPDLTTTTQPVVYIEATVATAGEPAHPDRVPPFAGDWDAPALPVPHDQVILRLRNSISVKYGVRSDYLRSGTLHDTDPFVIAIGAAPDVAFAARFEMDLPDIIRAVLPFGDSFVRIDIVTSEQIGGGIHHRNAVVKKCGSPVSTTVFQDPAFHGVSAILFSSQDEVHRPKREGAGLIVIRNPLASAPIPDGLFPFGRHYAVSDDGTILTRSDRSPESEPSDHLYLSPREEP